MLFCPSKASKISNNIFNIHIISLKIIQATEIRRDDIVKTSYGNVRITR